MSDVAVKAEGLHKRYQLGSIHGAECIGGLLSRGIQGILRRKAKDCETQSIWALRNVSFDINRGEVFGVIGNNGSGKSTLLKILSRVTEPTKGRVLINGRFCGLLEVGTGFHPELPGRDNVYMSGAILGMKRREIDRKFDEIVDFAEVEQFIRYTSQALFERHVCPPGVFCSRAYGSRYSYRGRWPGRYALFSGGRTSLSAAKE